jgi:S1-C subfamily serine protease
VIKRWSEGVIEQTINRDDTGQLLIHTADILPGNSGSGLFNREGVVIGVNVFLFNVRKDYDYNGGGCNVPPTARASVGPSMLAPYMRVVSGL